jgi:solute carrier family 25 2-oxodicarboxylate transporter 21
MAVGSEGYTGVLDCFRKIVKQEGFTRLYRGITAPILMEVPKRSVLCSVALMEMVADR